MSSDSIRGPDGDKRKRGPGDDKRKELDDNRRGDTVTEERGIMIAYSFRYDVVILSE
jgi:hypothetical protein